jgi:hypothetical protein
MYLQPWIIPFGSGVFWHVDYGRMLHGVCARCKLATANTGCKLLLCYSYLLAMAAALGANLSFVAPSAFRVSILCFAVYAA